MAPVFLGAAGTVVSAASTDCVVTYPTSAQNDLLVMASQFARTVTGAYTVATPTGWTAIDTSNVSGASDTRVMGTFWRLRGVSDTSMTISASTGTNTFGRAEIMAYKAGTFDPVNPIDAHTFTYATTSSATHTCPTITTLSRGVALAFFALSNNAAGTGAYTYTWTAPPAEQLDIGNTQGTVRGQITCATDSQAEKGATGTRVATATVSCAGLFTASISIAPSNPGQFFAAA